MEHGRGRGAVLTIAIQTVVETGSTNADLMLLAQGGAQEGLWLRAERQTGGRGRLGRTWQSPPGNLYASTLVRLRPNDPAAASLALVAAVALQEAVSTYLAGAGLAATAMLKWPNDLMIGDAKLSGILLERAEDAVVIGIGVNLAEYPQQLDRPTTSLRQQGVEIAPGDLLDTLAGNFAHWLARWRAEGLAPVCGRWTARAHPPGTALAVQLPDGGRLEGRFERLDADGALMLRLADGSDRVIHAGDIFLI